MFFFSLNVVLTYYHLARKAYIYMGAFVAMTLIEVLLLTQYHNAMEDILSIMLVSNMVFSLVIGVATVTQWAMGRRK
jgi:hypothetical protein